MFFPFFSYLHHIFITRDSDSFNSAAYYIFLKVGQSKINFSGGVLWYPLWCLETPKSISKLGWRIPTLDYSISQSNLSLNNNHNYFLQYPVLTLSNRQTVHWSQDLHGKTTTKKSQYCMAGNRLSFSLFVLCKPHRVPIPKFIYEYLSLVSLSEN